MKNAEISQILQYCGVKEHRLWDLPRPKWTEDDFNELKQILWNKESELLSKEKQE
jgi:hypothetical protein